MTADRPPDGARPVSVAPERLERWLAGFAERHGSPRWAAGADQVTASAPDGSRAWIAVPFPPLADPADLPGGLVEHAVRRRRIGVLLVRRGGHAAGVFDGTDLVASKVGSSYVQGATRAGGWSQQRFARRRDNQARVAFGAAADAAARVLLPAAGDLDAVVTGGDRSAVGAVLADPRLVRLRAPAATGPFLAVPDPRLRVLERTPEQFRAVRIRLLP